MKILLNMQCMRTQGCWRPWQRVRRSSYRRRAALRPAPSGAMPCSTAPPSTLPCPPCTRSCWPGRVGTPASVHWAPSHQATHRELAWVSPSEAQHLDNRLAQSMMIFEWLQWARWWGSQTRSTHAMRRRRCASSAAAPPAWRPPRCTSWRLPSTRLCLRYNLLHGLRHALLHGIAWNSDVNSRSTHGHKFS